MSLTSNLDIVECPNSTANVFVLRYPMLNNKIKSGTKILVKQNQVAVFVCDGNVLDVLAEGVHVINESSVPKLIEYKKLQKKTSNAYDCDIYYVYLTLFDNLKWGMVNSLILRDNDFGSLSIRCFGNFSFKVTDAGRFMKNLFGKISEFNEEDISLYMRTLIVTGVTETLVVNRIAALDFVANYDKFSIEDFKLVREKFADCGLFLQRLNIENITMPEDVEKLVNIKIKEKVDDHSVSQSAYPLNHPINAGTIHTSEMKKMFNFTHDFTITCVHCGATIAKNFKFCPQCGKENKEIAKECPNCHNIVAFKANFCPDCGTKLFDKDNVVLCKHCGKIVSETDLYCPDCGKSL